MEKNNDRDEWKKEWIEIDRVKGVIAVIFVWPCLIIIALLMRFTYDTLFPTVPVILISFIVILVVPFVLSYKIDTYFIYLNEPGAVPSEKLFFKIVDKVDIFFNGPKERRKLFDKYTVYQFFYLIGFLVLISLIWPDIETTSQSLDNSTELDISRYEIFTVLPTQYRFVDNYDIIRNKGYEIKIGVIRKPLPSGNQSQHLIKEGVREYISEIVYFLERDGEIIPLGIFPNKRGFSDSFERSHLFFAIDKNNFFGFPIETIDDPFVLYGIARIIDTRELYGRIDTRELYVTEVMLRLYIDDETLNLMPWFPVLD